MTIRITTQAAVHVTYQLRAQDRMRTDGGCIMES